MTAQLWEVVGGAKTGGVVVRSGKDLKSQEAPERLATGAVVEEVELAGQRLHFKLRSGKGPDTGWVTVQSKDATLLSRRGQMDGSEVWIVTNGSRGDIQPFLALACGLQRAGSKVRLFTSRDHGPFVQSFGVEFTGVCDGQDFLRRSWMESLSEEERKTEEQFGMMLWQGRVLEGDKLIIKEFASVRPDVLVCGHMHHGLRLVAQRGFGVRSRLAHIAYESFETWTDLWCRYERTCAFDRSLAREGFLSEPLLQDMSFVDFCRDLTSEETLNAVTSLYRENLTPVDKEIAARLKFIGNWVLRPGTSDEFFGGTDAQKELQRFLDAGSPPVYIGWGSCTPFNGDLQAAIFSAVLALQANSLRAVVLGGFASLDGEVLAAAADRFDPSGLTNAQAYAAANVLFIASAPHEWLLPRCVATLHHGGAGTTAAALRAGVPTLIMPCGYDQFQSARWVEQLGCGLQVLADENFTWQGLSKAMRRAKSDEAMRARARTVAETLRREPGVDAAIAELQRSIQEPPPNVEPARAPRHLARFFRFCSKRLEERRKSGVKSVNTTFQIKGDGGNIVLDLKRGEVRWGEDAAADCTVRMPDVAFQCFCCSWGVHFDVEFYTEQFELLEVLKEEFSLKPLPQHWREVADAFTELDEEK